MQINKIQSSNTSFGMALKVNPKLKPQIEQKGIEYLEKITKLGESIADVKKYNLVFDESLYPVIRKSEVADNVDYLRAFRNTEQYLGKPYEVPAGPLGDTVSGHNPKEPSIFRFLYGEKAKDEYAKFKKLDNLEQAAQLTRLLEKEDNIKIARNMQKSEKQALEDAQKMKLNTAIDNFLAKYKMDDFNVAKPKNKGFLHRIFG